MSKFSIGKIGCAVICTASMGLNAPAQDQANPQSPRQEVKVPQQAGAAQNVGQNGQHNAAQQHAGQDQTLMASCLVHGNQAEVALGRMAQEKAESGAVKKFAGMMVEDHQEFLGKLQKFAPNAGELSHNKDETSGRSGNDARNSGNNQRDQSQANQNRVNQNEGNQDQNSRNNNTAAQHAAGQANDISGHVAKLEQELAQQCLMDSQEKLSKVEGDKFDKCYIGMQIAMHAGMKSKLTVYSRHASGEFKQLVDQAMQTTSEHLEKAESIMKDLDDKSGSSRSERRSGSAATPDKSEKR